MEMGMVADCLTVDDGDCVPALLDGLDRPCRVDHARLVEITSLPYYRLYGCCSAELRKYAPNSPVIEVTRVLASGPQDNFISYFLAFCRLFF
jgi:hypothetical protein